MAIIQQEFETHNIIHKEGDGSMDENNSDFISGGDRIENLNALNNIKDSTIHDQVYISLQSPSREDNPITTFVKPPDFLSLKPLTEDEETAILMQVNPHFAIL